MVDPGLHMLRTCRQHVRGRVGAGAPDRLTFTCQASLQSNLDAPCRAAGAGRGWQSADTDSVGGDPSKRPKVEPNPCPIWTCGHQTVFTERLTPAILVRDRLVPALVSDTEHPCPLPASQIGSVPESGVEADSGTAVHASAAPAWPARQQPGSWPPSPLHSANLREPKPPDHPKPPRHACNSYKRLKYTQAHAVARTGVRAYRAVAATAVERSSIKYDQDSRHVLTSKGVGYE